MLVVVSLVIMTIASLFIYRFVTQDNVKLNVYASTSRMLDKNGCSVFR